MSQQQYKAVRSCSKCARAGPSPVARAAAGAPRVVRVWDREAGGLHAVGEAAPGLLAPLAWQPNGRHLYAAAAPPAASGGTAAAAPAAGAGRRAGPAAAAQSVAARPAAGAESAAGPSAGAHGAAADADAAPSAATSRATAAAGANPPAAGMRSRGPGPVGPDQRGAAAAGAGRRPAAGGGACAGADEPGARVLLFERNGLQHGGFDLPGPGGGARGRGARPPPTSPDPNPSVGPERETRDADMALDGVRALHANGPRDRAGAHAGSGADPQAPAPFAKPYAAGGEAAVALRRRGHRAAVEPRLGAAGSGPAHGGGPRAWPGGGWGRAGRRRGRGRPRSRGRRAGGRRADLAAQQLALVPEAGATLAPTTRCRAETIGSER